MTEWHLIAAVVAATVAVFGIVLTVIWVAYKFGEWKGEVNADRKLFKDFMSEVKEYMNEVKGSINEVKGSINENMKKTDRILKRLAASPTVKENSPVQHTEL